MHGRHQRVDVARGIHRQAKLHVVQGCSGGTHATEFAFVFKRARINEAAINVQQAVVAPEAAAQDAARVNRHAGCRCRQDPAAVQVGVGGFAA